MPGTPDFIIVPTSAGNKNLQTWINTVSGTPVDTEAVTLTDSLGNEKVGQQASAASVPVVIASDQSAVPVSGTVSATVSGTVAVSNFPATQPVAGTVAVSNFPATQPVSGSVSVTNFPATQPVSGTVAISNFPAPVPVPLDPAGNVVVDIQNQPQVNIQDSTGEMLLGTNNALNVHLASNEVLNLDGTGNVGVNVENVVSASVTNIPPVTNAGTFPVQDSATEANTLSIATTDASILANSLFQNQLIDLLTLILAQLKANNLLLSSSMSGLPDNSDDIASSLIQ
jgi:hypothetical protein